MKTFSVLLGSVCLSLGVFAAGGAGAQVRPAPEGTFTPEPSPSWKQAQIQLQRPGGNQPSAPPSPAGGTGAVMTAITPEGLIEIMKGAGFTKGQVETSGNSKNVKAYMGETPVYFFFIGCRAEGCSGFEFTTYYGKQEVSQAWINGFNSEKFGAKVWQTKQGNLGMSNGVYLVGGVTAENIKRQGEFWGVFLKEILEYNPS